MVHRGSMQAGTQEHSVDIEELAKGVYFLEITESYAVVTTKKIIKL